MVEFGAEVLGRSDVAGWANVSAAIRYHLARQRADGCMPDRVQVDGKAVYGPLGTVSVGQGCHTIWARAVL
jgi:hypothetical protein